MKTSRSSSSAIRIWCRTRLALIAAVMVVMPIVGCRPGGGGGTEVTSGGGSSGTSASSTAHPIHVVAILSTLGKAAAYGKDNRAGLDVAMDEVKAAGGINGRPVDITYEDTDGTPTGISTLVRKYASDPDIVAILGPTTTDETTTAANLLPQLPKPLLMLSVGSTGDWTPNGGKFNEWTFRSTRVDSVVVPALMRVVQQRLHPRTAALIYHPDYEWSMTVKPVYERVCQQLGIQLVAEEATSKAATDWSAQLTKIKSLKPDILIVNVLAGAGPKIVGQARDLGIAAPCVGTAAFTNPQTWPAGGATLEGTLVGDIFDPNATTPEVREFVKRYQDKYHRVPPAYSAYADAGLNLLCRAARQSHNPTDRKALRDALGSLTNVPTVLGTISYKGRGDITQHPVVLQITGGAYRRVG